MSSESNPLDPIEANEYSAENISLSIQTRQPVMKERQEILMQHSSAVNS